MSKQTLLQCGAALSAGRQPEGVLSRHLGLFLRLLPPLLARNKEPPLRPTRLATESEKKRSGGLVVVERSLRCGRQRTARLARGRQELRVKDAGCSSHSHEARRGGIYQAPPKEFTSPTESPGFTSPDFLEPLQPRTRV